ncbi:MAG TPA: hypothetical protein DEF82_07485 [Crocinitomicaceae bacterium]|nr:hypothetical protein [Flavobacteriales bacterium]HBW86568.1 hypothetical protein [Crocinitomicaceae bacterium]
MLQKSNKFFPLLLLLLFFSCSKGHGLHLTENNITVYYDDADQEKTAKEILYFLKANKISPAHPMDIKLVKKDSKFQLLFIKAEAFTSEELNFEEIRTFLELQQSLNTSVASFKTTPCEIAIANNQFDVKEIPNPL